MGVRDEDQVVGDDRGGTGMSPPPLQLPQLLAGLRVVAADVLPAVDDQERAAVPPRARSGCSRSARRRAACARAPRRSRGRRRRGRLVLDVALHVDDAVVDDRRAREAPLRVGDRKNPESSGPRSFFQRRFPVDVVAVEPLGAEEGDDLAPSVAGVEVAWVALGWRGPPGHALVGRALPEDLARPLVEPVDDEAVHGLGRRRGRCRRRGPTLAGRARRADRRGQEDAVAPHDRGGVGEPGDGRPPGEALARLDVPRSGGACPSTIPLACGPRKRGQFWSGASAANAAARRIEADASRPAATGRMGFLRSGEWMPIEAQKLPLERLYWRLTDPHSSRPREARGPRRRP